MIWLAFFLWFFGGYLVLTQYLTELFRGEPGTVILPW